MPSIYHDTRRPSLDATKERFGRLAMKNSLDLVDALQAAGGHLAEIAMNDALRATLTVARTLDSLRDDEEGLAA